ncbi:adenylyltransferase/cytidyltransferase family protein [Modestobacter sp. I12A-02628]|uniref:Bifunctional heptose 7-phosphate kinase/heptose 1-phosphate adenyltransferase n=1 Tax=Goekera deserti TaxID=2497753 RepID=A0A7K3WCY7_9ACTN|nr:PfkB family carbohydrate kinase [Goekera deserti]MPQ96923.1 adenylyltransferase/cytidyltransferase family protein [Goekera deserti]NDI46763.1 adenylyltransferase/cytidyltransferase family protein [Goekera deserti]NEL54332.1 bifunctional heptose 7-phosphate kinase/heptose 1-phosphate adenyltransferase [Goekera deserti]
MTSAARSTGPRVVVVGDAILDRYIRTTGSGRGRRSTVPSFSVGSMDASAGGAANAAVNVSALGGRAELVATVGSDPAGDELLRILASHRVDTRRVDVRPHPTAVKARVVHGHELVLRLDSGLDDASSEHRLADDGWTALPPDSEALLISDYGYGTLSDRAARRIVGRPPLVTVDARRLERWRPLRPTLVTCDEAQARRIAPGFDPEANGRDFGDVTSALLAATGADAVAVTLGQRGAVLVRKGGAPLRVAAPRGVDGEAVGSGDVFIASATMALVRGSDVVSAVEAATATATAATATAVTGMGTAVAGEADASVRTTARALPARCGELDDLAEWAAHQHRRGARIVFAGGCFDLLHEGHVALLTRARELGDVLVVAVNDDDGVRALKGPDRPVVDIAGRLRVLRALQCVDHATSFPGVSPMAAVHAVRPHVFVKGGDYSIETLPEADMLMGLGVQICILDLVPDRSTTRLVARARTPEGPLS